MHIEIVPAPVTSKPVITALLQPYLRDLATYFGGSTEPDAVFDYPYLAAYWEEPDQRHPFLIQADDEIAGFVFINRHSRLGQPNTRSIAEFYVLPQYRRHGIGKSARFTGRWEVAILEGNDRARQFWLSAIRDFVGDRFTEHRTRSWNGSILSFEIFADYQGTVRD